MATATKSASRSVEPHVKDIAADIEALRNDLSQLTDTVSKIGRQQTRRAARRVESLPEQISERYDETIGDLKSEFETLEKQFEKRVKKDPLPAVGIAAGVGFLAAMLLRN